MPKTGGKWIGCVVRCTRVRKRLRRSVFGGPIIATAILDRIAASLNHDQHSWGEPPAQKDRRKAGLFTREEDQQAERLAPFSLTRNLAERSSPSRLHFLAQNWRGLDRSGPFRLHGSTMRERGLMDLGAYSASRWSAEPSFRDGGILNRNDGEFSTGIERRPA